MFYVSRLGDDVGIIETGYYAVRRIGDNSFAYNSDSIGAKIGQLRIVMPNGRVVVVAVPFDPSNGRVQIPFVKYNSNGSLDIYAHRRDEQGQLNAYRSMTVLLSEMEYRFVPVPLFFQKSQDVAYVTGIAYLGNRNQWVVAMIRFMESMGYGDVLVIYPPADFPSSAVPIYAFADVESPKRALFAYFDYETGTIYVAYYSDDVKRWVFGSAPVEDENGTYYVVASEDVIGFKTNGEYRTFRGIKQNGYILHEIPNVVLDYDLDKTFRILIDGTMMGHVNDVYFGSMPLGVALPYKAYVYGVGGAPNLYLASERKMEEAGWSSTANTVESYEGLTQIDSSQTPNAEIIGIHAMYVDQALLATDVTDRQGLERLGIHLFRMITLSSGERPRDRLYVFWHALPRATVNIAEGSVEYPGARVTYRLGLEIRSIEVVRQS